jgi:hypothetical protein
MLKLCRKKKAEKGRNGRKGGMKKGGEGEPCSSYRAFISPCVLHARVLAVSKGTVAVTRVQEIRAGRQTISRR